MSRLILQVDQAMLETTLDRMVRKSVEETLNAMPDASGRPDCRRRQIRAVGRAQGVLGRPLRAGPGRQGRQDEPEGAQAQGRGVLLGGDRTLPAARGERRGGFDRHVPGRREHASGRRRVPVAVGRPHALADPERQAQARLRGYRRVAGAAFGPGVRVPVHGRRMAQKALGRQHGERGHTGGHRRRHGRTQGGARRGRGHEGGRRKLALVHRRHDRARPQGRETGDGRPVRRPGGRP